MGHGLWLRPDRRLREADGPQAHVSVGFVAGPHHGVAGKFERANTCESAQDIAWHGRWTWYRSPVFVVHPFIKKAFA